MEILETEKLMEKLEQVYSFEDYLDSCGAHCEEGFSFSGCFEMLYRQKNQKKMDIIQRSQIERGYAHQLIRGAKKPSRDKVILFAIGMMLTIPETQLLLRHSGFSPLSPRQRRDAVILFGVAHLLEVDALRAILLENGFEILQ